MPHLVTLGLIQMQCSAYPKENLKKGLKKTEECIKKGAQIVVLPELFLSEYFCQGPKDEKNFKYAELVPGPTTEAFSELAKKNKAVILVSLFEKTKAGKFFNSAAVIGVDGKVMGAYHKMHIPSLPPGLYSEDYYFARGDEGFKVFDTPYGKISPLICYDQWFPECARIAASKGAQILLYPTAIGWPQIDRKWKNEAEHEAWQITQRSHSIDNNVFVAAVNRVGLEGELKFWGTSFVSDPFGRVVVKASTDKEENIITTIDLDLIKEMRTEWPFLDERQVRCENA